MFDNIERRLVLRYADRARTFSFNKVRINSSNQALFDLAGALSSVQNKRMIKVTTVVTRRLV